ncbi:MAG TPA: HpcH/HpaI aldolase/citrate lyase family protein [Stellaceae bacterium]|jgi:4-hydroxy-2-oxoheptanedioate aldolase|nr:HpcH/HpaI aldolase/citrate lyase family protein [Stellaceae bacterium]
MDLPTNNFKRALRAGDKQIGLWLSLMNGYTAEICAGAGFDWFLLDAEHAPNTLETILHQLQAVAPYGVAPVVRPPNRDPDTLKLLLDMGVQNFLIPMVESAEQARALVGAVRYPPHGHRGVGHVLGRASRWGRVGDYLKRSDEEICLVVQIESRTGMDNLEAIAAVEGVDGLFVGPADLTASLGHTGDMAHPEMQAAIDSTIGRIIATGKPCGTITGGAANTKRLFARGCGFVAAGVDALLLAVAADRLARELRE